jgi:SAM-dependent methyltransferase
MVTGESEGAALARLYDVDLIDDPGDLDLYLALAARTGGPVLELGAGTGRIAVGLAAAGHEVTAVDRDPAAIDRARRRAAEAGKAVQRRLSFVVAEMDGLRLPTPRRRFRLGLIALNTLLLLDRDGQAGALETLARHLAPGGLAVVDVWLPDAEDLGRFDGRLSLEYVRHDPETGLLVTKSASARHDAATGTVELTAIYEEGSPGEQAARWVRRDRIRLIGADELTAMATDAGLVVEALAGDRSLSPFGPGSERLVLIAERR